ncbi:MAG: hypothetical protein ACKOA9_02100 [Actinomycetota bacterium]
MDGRDEAGAREAPRSHPSRAQQAKDALRRFGAPEAAIAASVAFGIWALLPELTLTWRANDSSIHGALVRWVAERVSGGHLPLDGWFPYLSLGAARFHHYQSLPHILTGTAGVAVGADRAFAWTLYLLLATWPISVYLGGRLLGLGRAAAGAAGALAPLIASSQKMGFQWPTYTWRGYGAWAQLWGIWLLPIVIGLAWQAVARGRHRGKAAAAFALLIPTHLVMAYLAALLLPVWALVGAPRRSRVVRAALLGGAAIVASAWFVSPLLAERAWVTRNLLADPIGYRSVGVGPMLRAFSTGQTLDGARVPVLTALAIGGLVVALGRVRRSEVDRALIASLAVGAVLYAGRTSFPSLGALPGMEDVFMPRFIVAVQLPALYLAGVALVGVLRWAMAEAEGRLRLASGTLATLAVVGALSPAIAQRVDYAMVERRLVAQQELTERADRPQLRELLAIAAARGPGRVYQSMNPREVDPFRLGSTPFYMAFLSEDADAIGFTRPTWSILSDIESGFDERDARQYPIFGIRYVIRPPGVPPAVPATQLASRRCCVLWQVGDSGYLRLAQSTRAVTADRFTLLERAREWFGSEDFDRGEVWTIGYAGAEAPGPVPGSDPTRDPASLGRISRQEVRLEDGFVLAEVEVSEPSLLVLSATFDPGWTATVDGVPRATQMVSPGVLAVRVEPGDSVVQLEWRSFPYYGPLLLGWLAPLGLWWWDRRRRTTRKASVDEDAP